MRLPENTPEWRAAIECHGFMIALCNKVADDIDVPAADVWRNLMQLPQEIVLKLIGTPDGFRVIGGGIADHLGHKGYLPDPVIH